MDVDDHESRMFAVTVRTFLNAENAEGSHRHAEPTTTQMESDLGDLCDASAFSAVQVS
jgi:hypothetical protein